MKNIALPSVLLLVVLAVNVSPAAAYTLNKEEVKIANESFEELWENDFEWKFDELPTKGMVPQNRVPWAGYIYPDNQGGCWRSLQKYDRAFYRGRHRAAGYEQQDIEMHKETTRGGFRGGGGLFGGLFGGMAGPRRETPHWAGHCNGWTAAAIRHAEPVHSVRKNGVVFTPADIKGLLAELYVYSNSIHLGGKNGTINPGQLHAVLANWLGRGDHPVGADISPGKEVWNYPIYGYTSKVVRRGRRMVEVRTNLGYTYMLQQEHHKAPKNFKFMSLHYLLELDEEGRIVGGQYYNDSSQIDMLWAPFQPAEPGKPGNEMGNPYISAKEILAIWRASVPEEKRVTWWNIDPTDEDRILVEEAADEALVDVEAIEEAIVEETEEVATEEEATEPAETDEAA